MAVIGFFLEIAVMIEVGSRIGVVPVLLLIIMGFVVGAGLIKRAGLGMLQRLRRPDLQRGFGTSDAASHFLMMLAGLLFMLPGFLSDALALLLLVEPLRERLAAHLVSKVEVRSSGWPGGPAPRGPVIDGEAVVIEGEILPPER